MELFYISNLVFSALYIDYCCCIWGVTGVLILRDKPDLGLSAPRIRVEISGRARALHVLVSREIYTQTRFFWLASCPALWVARVAG